MGGKSGGSQHTPIELRANLRSSQRSKTLFLLSEGEVEAGPDNLERVYLDGTVIQKGDVFNFKDVSVDYRLGLPNQEIIPGFTDKENEIPVGVSVKKDTPITRTVTDSNVRKIRLTVGVEALVQYADNNDAQDTIVHFNIKVGNENTPLSIGGQSDGQYLRQVEIIAPKAPFDITVSRVTPDSTSSKVVNKTFWASYTEITPTKYNYPNLAMLGLKLDAKNFSSFPRVNVLAKGIKVRVPSNYNPETREYSGIWDGTFKVAYTNNPAWIYYDIWTEDRYGLGHRVGLNGCDKWAMYSIARYCDVMVDDGMGGLEPRMTCNIQITDQKQAYDVINSLASIFRAIPVWNGVQATAIQDRVSDPVAIYTNANVIDGKFTRSYSAYKARHNCVEVEYIDKLDGYKRKIEYVEDTELKERYQAPNLAKFVAYGCTSRGQAQRAGKWLLITEKYEKETITFSVGLEGLKHLPGDIIKIADNYFAGTDIGGRVTNFEDNKVTLDRSIVIDEDSYLTYIDDYAKHKTIKIVSVSENIVTLESEPVGISKYAIWVLATKKVNSKLYRAIGIAEKDNIYTITALEFNPQKEAIVDKGASFEKAEYTSHQPPKVTDVGVSAVVDGKVNVSWTTTTGSSQVSYKVKIYKNGALVDTKTDVKDTNLDIESLENGDYQVVVEAYDDRGSLVSENVQAFTIDRPLTPTNVIAIGTLSAIALSWDYADNYTETEIWRSDSNNITEAKKIAKLKAISFVDELGASQTKYYWLRHVKGRNYGLMSEAVEATTGSDIDAELAVLKEKLDIDIGPGGITETKIADGSITTPKLATNAVVAHTIHSGAIVSRHLKVGVIEGQHIKAGVIGAEKLHVNNLSAISSNLGAIKGGSIDINGKFMVDANGDVEIRTNANNKGLVFKGDTIYVYNADGNIVLKLGWLGG